MKEMEAQIEAEKSQRATPTRIRRKKPHARVEEQLPPSSPPEPSPQPYPVPPQYYQQMFKSAYSFEGGANNDDSDSNSNK